MKPLANQLNVTLKYKDKTHEKDNGKPKLEIEWIYTERKAAGGKICQRNLSNIYNYDVK